MANPNGTPIWYELMTSEPDKAQSFYGSVVDWTFAAPLGGLDRDYRIASASDGSSIGGVMRTPPHAEGMKPTWLVYFGVGDVDEMTEKVRSLGGRVNVEPTDIPGVGRFSFNADPQGAKFYLMCGNSEEDSRAFAPDAVGHASWNELVTSDQKAALDFYGKLFGWQHGGAMPMGDVGDYTFVNHGGAMIGAMMDMPKKGKESFWNFAFNVADIDAAKASIEAGGGTVTHGPVELPTEGDWLVQATDPTGARAMFTGRRSKGAA